MGFLTTGVDQYSNSTSETLERKLNEAKFVVARIESELKKRQSRRAMTKAENE